MRFRVSRRQLLAVLAVASCIPFSGCRSSSVWKKMPGASLFASQDPDPATLAGTERTIPDLPESPAVKYEPSSLVATSKSSTAAGNATSGTSAYGAGAYGTNGITATTTTTPTTGLAAAANGYQTGPYQMGQTTTATTTLAASTTPAASGLPNPYGGTYSGATSPATSAPDVQLPTSVTGALAGSANSQDQSTSLPAGLAGYPMASAGGSATNASSPSLPSLSAAIAESAQSPALPPASSAYQASGTAPASAVTTAQATQGGFSPGTTARSTGYNFGTGGSDATTGTSTLPPNTATLPSTLLR